MIMKVKEEAEGRSGAWMAQNGFPSLSFDEMFKFGNKLNQLWNFKEQKSGDGVVKRDRAEDEFRIEINLQEDMDMPSDNENHNGFLFPIFINIYLNYRLWIWNHSLFNGKAKYMLWEKVLIA